MLWLALATLVGFGGLGCLLIVLQERDLVAVLLGSDHRWLMLGLGVGYGVIASFGAWWIIARPSMTAVRMKYAALIGPLVPSRWMQVCVSICAGVGEEILFRGALQHWCGILLTALGFVALHGYINPRDMRITIYGIYLTIAMVGLGFIAREYGLLAPMVAHTVIDIILLHLLVREWRKQG
ncbi:MAG TPA: CPBP family intramembrane metalloprotease [Flavobacteriales bacterium]|nr:CPBP family intramembrane metalloprotease [Flavobacteriales bacterium]